MHVVVCVCVDVVMVVLLGVVGGQLGICVTNCHENVITPLRLLFTRWPRAAPEEAVAVCHARHVIPPITMWGMGGGGGSTDPPPPLPTAPPPLVTPQNMHKAVLQKDNKNLI